MTGGMESTVETVRPDNKALLEIFPAAPEFSIVSESFKCVERLVVVTEYVVRPKFLKKTSESKTLARGEAI